MTLAPEALVVAPEAVTPQLLTSLLTRAGAAEGRVVEVAAAPFAVGRGFIGRLARLTMTWEGNGPQTLIAKAPATGEGSRGVAELLGMYEREVAFYRDLAGGVTLGLPRVFHAAFDPASGGFLILMEDLSAKPTVDQLSGCEPGPAALVAEELGRFQAAHWNAEDRADLSRLGTLAARPFDAISSAYAAALEPALELAGDALPAGGAEVCRHLGERLAGVMAALSRPPLTLGHGDFRVDNMFFDGGRLVVIDWQLATLNRGPRDLGYFFSQSLTGETRRAHGEELLARYHAALVRHGVSGYSLEQAGRDMRLGMLFHLAYPVVALGSTDHDDDRGERLLRAILARAVEAVVDLECIDLT